MKEKANKVYLIKIQNFCSSKDHVKNMKRQGPQNIVLSDKELKSRL